MPKKVTVVQSPRPKDKPTAKAALADLKTAITIAQLKAALLALLE